VALHPDDHGLLGNLALSYLLAGRVEAAQKAIHAATRIDSSDAINRRLEQVIVDVASGKRSRPTSLQEI
jgi:hypothetical protein